MATKKKVTRKKAVASKAVSKKVSKKAAPTPKVTKAVSTKKAKPTVGPAAKKKTSRKSASQRTSQNQKTKTAAKNVRSGLQPYSDFDSYQAGKNEEYMSAPMKDHFRHILNNWRSQLMSEVDRTVGHMKDDASNFADLNDRATQEEEFALELRTRDRERKLIRKIAKTLDRIDEDDYGWCDQCGIEIGIQRLEARPTADLCIDCKTLDEIREKQTRL